MSEVGLGQADDVVMLPDGQDTCDTRYVLHSETASQGHLDYDVELAQQGVSPPDEECVLLCAHDSLERAPLEVAG